MIDILEECFSGIDVSVVGGSSAKLGLVRRTIPRSGEGSEQQRQAGFEIPGLRPSIGHAMQALSRSRPGTRAVEYVAAGFCSSDWNASTWWRNSPISSLAAFGAGTKKCRKVRQSQRLCWRRTPARLFERNQSWIWVLALCQPALVVLWDRGEPGIIRGCIIQVLHGSK